MSRKRATIAGSSAVEKLIEQHLAHRGLPDRWLYERIGMSRGSWYGMLRRGSMRMDVVAEVASAFDITLPELLTPPVGLAPSATPIASEPVTPYRQPYLEQRVEVLEQQVAELRRQQHTTKPHTR